MNVSVFVSTLTGLTAFSSDETGGNLPAEYAPWTFVRRLYLASATDPIAEVVREKGFMLVSTGRKK